MIWFLLHPCGHEAWRTVSSTGIAAVDAGCLFVSNNALPELAKKLDSRVIAIPLSVRISVRTPFKRSMRPSFYRFPPLCSAPGLPWR